MVDFPQVIRNLRTKGYSLRKISETLDVPVPTVASWAQGRHPRFEGGRALCQLYEKVMGEPAPETIQEQKAEV